MHRLHITITPTSQATDVEARLNEADVPDAWTGGFNHRDYLADDGMPLAVAEVTLPDDRTATVFATLGPLAGVTVRELAPGEEGTAGLRRAPPSL